MSDSVPLTSLEGRTVDTYRAVSAGRHMKQPLRSTISASRESTRGPTINLVAKWEAELESNQIVGASNDPVAHNDPTEKSESSPEEISAVAQKMKLLDERDHRHRRKKRVALLFIVTVIIAIPTLLVALIFFV